MIGRGVVDVNALAGVYRVKGGELAAGEDCLISDCDAGDIASCLGEMGRGPVAGRVVIDIDIVVFSEGAAVSVGTVADLTGMLS